ncbi:LOB domain-containing protein 34 [Arabidopsis thaliana]|uniref:LOB domain-containing protein 34 n=3 Tax=Arabidopsis TaxID=3701 RepID=LBD34_ARATH|nr:Lateral organ boundaries (LOB) domain family protein [Arabidopsis thaliana]P59469.1 RecName: Full=LOB domain-containing protein 34; AltName: Full=ASYMMETRIC LEAVES 2-like protein 42; Short=AS2-like protein 42 [Arabidopsis thaliana]AED92111.1 Lateral organ boundaries (LOB) domain family protein [Arabidopsis thaliana]KAG7602298.1 Lateral organ boundaries LOB [Arabidopsis thaliana x Arabidopsis arenosa]VYS66875.1 unnamed protein product [Arabidopsis thaliana]|eukprot:NP_197010.2 Lateral organ boundaries (LOB) domain family protein [Arabidopsis thaliana]
MTLQGSSGVNNGGYVNQCAACRHQRRRCTPDCFFRPYFPAERHQEFQNFHRLHSNTRLQKKLKELGLSPEEQREAMSSIIYESNIRSQFPGPSVAVTNTFSIFEPKSHSSPLNYVAPVIKSPPLSSIPPPPASLIPPLTTS